MPVFQLCPAPLAALAAGILVAAGSAPALAGQWRDGDHAYQKVCGHCHETGIGPKIKERNLPPEYIRKVVRNGNRAMPAFRPSEVDEATLADVARVVGSGTAVSQK